MGSVSPSPSSGEFKILIVGGGIAGLAAALFLHTPSASQGNRHITVLEQSSLHTEIGATISLQPNASQYLPSLSPSIPESLNKKGAMIDRAFRICSTDGKEFKRVDLTRKSFGEGKGERMLYHRQDLHGLLKDACLQADVEILTKQRVVGCDPEEGSVTLSDGTELGGFDLIVGADGIKSQLRKYVLREGEKGEAVKTGQAAYRMMINAKEVEGDEEIRGFLDPREAVTTMVMGHKGRLIMGPARNGDVFSIVAMVPDESEETETEWTTKGDMATLLEAFKEFPDWCKRLFSHAAELGLWQLRDLDPLSTWKKGRLILIGDAAHAMLPTQGQGASQGVEDAEALRAFFSDISGKPSKQEILSRLKIIDETRRPRATQIQLLSRESAKPATDKGDTKIKISPDQYMDYCCNYNGAVAWRKEHLNNGFATAVELETGISSLRL